MCIHVLELLYNTAEHHLSYWQYSLRNLMNRAHMINWSFNHLQSWTLQQQDCCSEFDSNCAIDLKWLIKRSVCTRALALPLPSSLLVCDLRWLFKISRGRKRRHCRCMRQNWLEVEQSHHCGLLKRKVYK